MRRARLVGKLALVAWICVASLLVPGRGHAQTAETPTAPTLDYSVVDRATVRVIAVQGVGTQRVESRSRRYRLMAVPEAGHGSGLLVSADGLIITARHVVEDARIVAVWVPGEARAYVATVVYQDPDVDYAILAIQGHFTSFVPLVPLGRTLHVREQVHAIGYPLDARRTDPQSAQGIVSGVLPDGSLQLDIALNPGNSGGPLIDADEHVLGIVVARGDLEQGVQGIGVAVPVAPILAALASEVPSRLDAARAALLAYQDGAQVAELVRLLVRVGASELIQEILDEMDHHGTSELLDRLHQLEAETSDPEIQVLVAAYYWDAAAVILERAGGMMRASEMPAGSDRELVADLMTRAVRLAYVAAERQPELERRSPFVRRVLYYFTDPRADATPATSGGTGPILGPSAPAPSTSAPPAPVTSASAGPQERGWGQPEPEPERPHDPNHDHHIRLGGSAALILDPAGNGIGGGAGRFLFEASPGTGRFGVFAIDAVLGADLSIGTVSAFLFSASAELGVMMRFGDHLSGVIGASWLPTVMAMSGRPFEATVGGWRAYGGIQIDDVLLVFGWRGLHRENTYSLHQLELACVVAVD